MEVQKYNVKHQRRLSWDVTTWRGGEEERLRTRKEAGRCGDHYKVAPETQIFKGGIVSSGRGDLAKIPLSKALYPCLQPTAPNQDGVTAYILKVKEIR